MTQAAAGLRGARRSLADVAHDMQAVFAGEAAAGDAAGRLTDRTIRALGEGGFLGMWIPKEFGGVEAAPVEALGTVENLSYADGSTGWVFMALQVAMGSAAAYLPAGTAKELFGKGSWPLIAGQGAPLTNKGIAAPGGYRLSGNWSYGSGLTHSSWIHTGANIFDGATQRMRPDGKLPEVRIFILPVAESRLTGNWDVMGLRATGSVDYTIDNVFVPEEYTHIQTASEPIHGGSIFTLAIYGISCIGHTGFALGVGRRMLDELRSVATAESGRPQTLPVRGGGEAFLEKFGVAEAKLRAARAFAYENWAEIEHVLGRGDRPSTRQITLARLGLNYATTAVAEVCAFAYHYGGGIALRDGVMQRCFRDMNAGTQHASVSFGILRECARELLGMAEGKVWAPRALIDP